MRRIASLSRACRLSVRKEMKDAPTSAGDGEINKSKGKLFVVSAAGMTLQSQSQWFFACHEPGRACVCVLGAGELTWR